MYVRYVFDSHLLSSVAKTNLSLDRELKAQVVRLRKAMCLQSLER